MTEEMELVRRCRRRDPAAFESLYGLYRQKALRTAFLVTRSLPAAEDALQEAFIQVWRRIDALREDGAFRSWFYRILLNAASRAGRPGRLTTIPLDLQHHDRADPSAPLVEERVAYGEELGELRTAIAALPDLQRITLVLRYFSGLGEAEIAYVLQVPLGTVKSRLHNARRTLHELVGSPMSDRRGGG